MFAFFQLLVLFIFSLCVLLLISHKIARLILSVLFSLFISLQCISLQLGNSLIDYKFYKHSNLSDVSASAGLFWKEILAAIVLMLFLVFLFNFLYKKLHLATKKTLVYFGIIAPLIFMLLSGGIISNIADIVKLNTVEDTSLDAVLLDLNIQPEAYTHLDALEADKGKNIVIMSLESFEKGFLSDNFKNLTPNFRQFKNDFTFLDMHQSEGSNWTTGSMYTYITGVPMFLKGNQNKVLENAVEAKITGLSHVLDKAGYQQLYLLGNPEFNGVIDLLTTYGIKSFPQSYYDNKYGTSKYGLHDFDLFNEAKEQVLNFKSGNKPFALYMSSISTHFPNGVYDARLEKNIDKKGSEFEFMIASLDYMVKDFIDFLDKQQLLENTVFYIFPDHILMGSGSGVVDKFDERGLFLITNADKELLGPASESTHISQIDLPKLILSGAKVDHNAKFLTDFIEGDKEAFINNNKEKLLALNEASLRIEGFNDDFEVHIKTFEKAFNTNTLKLTSKNANLVFETDSFSINKNRYHIFLFDKYMKPEHLESNDRNFIYKNFNDKVNVLLDIDENQMTIFLRKGNTISSVRKSTKATFKISKETIANIQLLEDYEFNNTNKLESKFTKVNNVEGELYITSSPNNITESTRTSIQYNQTTLEHKTGMNIIVLDHPNRIENFNVNQNESEQNKFLVRVNTLLKAEKNFVIVPHDVQKIENTKYRDELIKFGLEKLPYLKEKRAYVCYSESGINLEHLDRKPISIQVNVKGDQNLNISLKDDTSRFIAHAGGAIDGDTYTNALEALNQNYNKGFRWFELDIIKTSDGHFVATHDWKRWRKQHGFEVDTPIDLKSFLATKIKNKYSPISMNEINDWFRSHKDAMLVTDKVNTPKSFSSKFEFKNRLFMELFSVDAVKEAQKENIKFLAAPKVFEKMKYLERLAFIDENNVKYMTVSRKSILANKAYYKRLKAKGVKLYAYHLNFGNWSNEAYVFMNEFKYIHGVYADNWTFD